MALVWRGSSARCVARTRPGTLGSFEYLLNVVSIVGWTLNGLTRICHGKLPFCMLYSSQAPPLQEGLCTRCHLCQDSPFLGIDPEKTVIWKDKCTRMFIAAVFTISKTWKKPKCLLTDKQIKDVVCRHTHTGIYSDHKREQYNTICSNMNGPRMIIRSEVRQKKINIIWYYLFTESKKKLIEMDVITKQK